jgi:hypothetical protein
VSGAGDAVTDRRRPARKARPSVRIMADDYEHLTPGQLVEAIRENMRQIPNATESGPIKVTLQQLLALCVKLEQRILRLETS